MDAAEAHESEGRSRRSPVVFGPYTFDAANGILRKDGRELPLPPRVLGVLALLLERAGDLVPRQQMIERVWKDAFVTDTSLAEAVSGLRQALGDDPQSPTYIQTVHRRGYRFVAPVEPLPPPPSLSSPGPLAIQPLPVDAPVVVSPTIGGQLLPWSAAALCAVFAVAAVWQLTNRRDQVPVEARFMVGLPAGQTFDTTGPPVALSPDGSRAAWSACDVEGCRLYTRLLSQLDPALVPGSDRASSPFFSPDGRSIGFFSDGRLKTLALGGGAPAAIADVTVPRGGVWTNDGRIVFGSGLFGGLSQVPAGGGAASALTLPLQDEGEIRHGFPSLSADGRTLLFITSTTTGEDAPGRLAVAAPNGTAPISRWSTLLAGTSLASLMAADIALVARGQEVQAVAFDPVRRVLSGVPQTLATGGVSTSGGAWFAASRSGALLYPISDRASQDVAQLRWLGEAEARGASDLKFAGRPVLSPDGRRVAWTSAVDALRSDIWIGDLARGAVTRLTHEGANESPVWSADGARLYFARRDGALFRLASIGVEDGAIALGAGASHHRFPASASPDGRTVAFVEAAVQTRGDIWVSGSTFLEPSAAVRSPFDDVAPALSPDGSLLAYQSDEGGRWDVYVQRLADARRAIVSVAGGEVPLWSRDGSTLFYRSGRSLMRASIDAASLAVGSPITVTDLRGDIPLGIAPDGRVLLLHRPPPTARSAVLAINWEREARRLLGPPTATLPR